MNIFQRILAASAYLFGIPAIYIVLTEQQRKSFVRYHADRALVLWLIGFGVFFSLRMLIDFIWSKNYLPGLIYLEWTFSVLLCCYLVFCAIRALLGEDSL